MGDSAWRDSFRVRVPVVTASGSTTTTGSASGTGATSTSTSTWAAAAMSPTGRSLAVAVAAMRLTPTGGRGGGDDDLLRLERMAAVQMSASGSPMVSRTVAEAPDADLTRGLRAITITRHGSLTGFSLPSETHAPVGAPPVVSGKLPPGTRPPRLDVADTDVNLLGAGGSENLPTIDMFARDSHSSDANANVTSTNPLYRGPLTPEPVKRKMVKSASFTLFGGGGGKSTTTKSGVFHLDDEDDNERSLKETRSFASFFPGSAAAAAAAADNDPPSAGSGTTASQSLHSDQNSKRASKRRPMSIRYLFKSHSAPEPASEPAQEQHDHANRPKSLARPLSRALMRPMSFRLRRQPASSQSTTPS